ncbi:MAG: hypothetical protein OQK46_09225 [Gammaproteobacteria bacterium]|nr:hypothetical protein [Gammaproteobacteria bacterium]
MTPLIKQLTEATIKEELETHLERDETANRENFFDTKTIKSSSGNVDMQTHRYVWAGDELSAYGFTYS